ERVERDAVAVAAGVDVERPGVAVDLDPAAVGVGGARHRAHARLQAGRLVQRRGALAAGGEAWEGRGRRGSFESGEGGTRRGAAAGKPLAMQVIDGGHSSEWSQSGAQMSGVDTTDGKTRRRQVAPGAQAAWLALQPPCRHTDTGMPELSGTFSSSVLVKQKL